MKRFVMMTAAAVALTAATGVARAQETDNGGILKSPVFLFMPGGVTVNAISAPDALDTESGFLLRFQTTIPTASKWVTPVFGTQWLPNGVGGNGGNALIFFYGAVFPFIQPEWTGGWLTASLDPLGVYAPASYGNRPYSHEFVGELAIVLPFGSKMMRNMGPFSNLAAYFLVDNQFTHPPLDENGDKDYFRPTLLYGLALPIAPWK
ncbi:MAG TPA: hypothetical protein VFS05_06765 [Gemmatimonadaceae bacterium]|nr:hypothetical protein [Gemmatimonadaceae bacterium]